MEYVLRTSTTFIITQMAREYSRKEESHLVASVVNHYLFPSSSSTAQNMLQRMIYNLYALVVQLNGEQDVANFIALVVNILSGFSPYSITNVERER